MARIYWKSTWSRDTARIEGMKTMPKKPVIWSGVFGVRFTQGEQIITDERSWRAPYPIRRKDAQAILCALLAEIVAEHGEIECVMWFELKSP